MSTVVRKVCGHASRGPSGVDAQSCCRVNSFILGVGETRSSLLAALACVVIEEYCFLSCRPRDRPVDPVPTSYPKRGRAGKRMIGIDDAARLATAATAPPTTRPASTSHNPEFLLETVPSKVGPVDDETMAILIGPGITVHDFNLMAEPLRKWLFVPDPAIESLIALNIRLGRSCEDRTNARCAS